MESNLPQCIGFIMDGNRRFAREQGLETMYGHKAGEEKFYEVAQWIKEAKIPHAVFYAFSTENWKRTEEEVNYLLILFNLFLNKILSEIEVLQIKVKVIGNKKDFSEELQNLINELEEKSAVYSDTTIWVALSYGGHAEIISAVNTAVEIGEVVTPDSFSRLLFTCGMPDPDLIIRTGGEKRLSNFLPWQSVYSELFFIDTYWPAFTKDEFKAIVAQYGDRQRRHGT